MPPPAAGGEYLHRVVVPIVFTLQRTPGVTRSTQILCANMRDTVAVTYHLQLASKARVPELARPGL